MSAGLRCLGAAVTDILTLRLILQAIDAAEGERIVASRRTLERAGFLPSGASGELCLYEVLLEDDVTRAARPRTR